MECWVDGVSRQRWGDTVARRKPPQATPALPSASGSGVQGRGDARFRERPELYSEKFPVPILINHW